MMNKINRNIVCALEHALTAKEHLERSLEDAKSSGAEACANVYEELLQDSEKAIQRLQGLITGHVKKGKWD